MTPNKANEPTIERLSELISLDHTNGNLSWKKRKGSRGVAGAIAGGIRKDGYIRIQIDGKKIMAHRVAFALSFGRWPSNQVDHINGDRMDNRPENLREASHSENARNRGISSNNKSGVIGVHWHKFSMKWAASIRIKGKQVSLGYFSSIDDAKDAREAASRDIYGAFAR